MIEVPFIGLLLVMTGAVALAFVIAWNWSVARWYDRQRRLADKNKTLNAAVNKLADRMETDEMRTAIDLGKESVLNDVEDLTSEIRKSMERAP